MSAPTNTTAGTAIDVGTLPASITQTVDDAGTTYTVWYSYLADDNGLIGVFGYGGGMAYTPRTQIYSDAGITQIVDTGISYADRPTQFQGVAGTTYYFQFTPPAGDPSPAVLTLTVTRGPRASIPSGSIAVNDDTQGFPIVFLSSANGDDNNVLQAQTFAPAGEAGDVLASGISLWANAWDGNLELFGADFVSITTVAIDIGFDISIRACYGQNVFYVGQDLNPVVVKTVDATGTIGATTWTLTGNNSIKGLAASDDGTILYFAVGGTSVPIQRWDLVNDVALSDLAAAVTGYDVSDILYLSDDTILVAYYDVGVDFKVLQYDTSGTVLNTYDFGNVNMPASTFSRIAYAPDNPNSFWAWTHSAPSTSTFQNIKVSDGSTLASVDYTEYETGVYQGAATATPTADFGISFSCPFLITRSADVCEAVVITVQPISQTIDEGNTATLTVTATGTDPLGYQWYQGESGDVSTPVGTNSSSYTTDALTENTSFWVQVSNICGSGSTAFSDTAVITVTPTPPTPGPPAATTLQIRWLRQSPTISSDGKRIVHRRFQLDCLVGNGLQTGAAEDVNPAIECQTSDDGGATWSNVREMFTGRIGAYLTQAKLYQLGAAYNRAYRVYGNSATAFCIVQAWLDIDGSDH